MTRTSLHVLASVACLTFSVLVRDALTDPAQLGAETPRLIDRNPAPVYPEAARAVPVEGPVQFRATIRSDGTVESVTILNVPWTNVGFEAAVEEAVRRWKFQPATRDGVAVTGIYEGHVNFELAIPREWIFPASSREVWSVMLALTRELKFVTERVDATHQLLITRSKNYRSGPFPLPEDLRLLDGWFPESVQFHLYVAPKIEPARVSIGSILETQHRPDARRGALMVYGNDQLGAWFLSLLSRRLGKNPEALSISTIRRAEQARRLMPANLKDACSAYPAIVTPGGDRPELGITNPRRINEVKAVFPKEELEGKRGGSVFFRGEITEHGTLINIRDSSPSNISPNLVIAAQLATSLWRFEPATWNGCGARIIGRFEHEFVN